MATDVYGFAISKVFGEQVSLTTTASHLLYYPKYHEVKMYCASDWRIGIAPKLANVQLFTASGSTYTNYTTEAIGRTSAQVQLDAMATGDMLYLGTTAPVRGFYFNVGSNVNAETATLDMEYMSAITAAGVATFTDVAADSDGTDSGGATLAQDGVYTFTLLTAGTVENGIISALNSTTHDKLYWYRFKPSAALSATVDIVDIIPACDTVSYGYMQGGTEYQWSFNQSSEGAFEFDHTGTGTLNVTWLRHGGQT